MKESRDSSSTTNVQRERKARQVKNTGDITAEQQKQQEDYYQRYILKNGISSRYNYHKILRKYSANNPSCFQRGTDRNSNDKSGISCISLYLDRILYHFVYHQCRFVINFFSIICH